MKARIPTRQDYNIVVKLKDLHGKWKALKKGASNMSCNQRSRDCICGQLGWFVWRRICRYNETFKYWRGQEIPGGTKRKGSKRVHGCTVDTKLPQSQLDGQTDKLFENILVRIPISSYTSRTFRTLTVQCFRDQSLLEGMVHLSICTFCSTTGLGIVKATSNTKQPMK